MKILVVCQYYYPEPFRITEICESLVSKGHEVVVVTGLPNYPEGKVLKDYRFWKKRNESLNGVKILRCFEIGRGKNKFALLLNYLSFVISASFRVLFIDNKNDVILVNQLSPVLMAIPAIIYKIKHKKRILLYCLDLWPDSLAAGGIKLNSILYKMFYYISKWIYYSADLILISSQMFEKYFTETLEINSSIIHHLPQFAEDLYTSNTKMKSHADKYSKIFNFVFAGNIGVAQSVETIIHAANLVKDMNNIFFHIVGDGSKLEECKKIVDELDIQNIAFYGRKSVEEMPKYYAMADAMLVTLQKDRYLSFTLPGKIQSYMAAGKPILGALNGEASRVIMDAKCGYTCDAEDFKTLAKIIKDFCIDENIRQMGTNAKEYYNENYSKDKFMFSLINNLNRLLEM